MLHVCGEGGRGHEMLTQFGHLYIFIYKVHYVIEVYTLGS